MGSSSKSSSNSTSSQTTDSFNQTLTSSLTGNGGLSINNTGAVSGGTSNLDYAYDTNNTTNDQTYALGANSTASPSNSTGTAPAASTSGIDWSQVLIWVVGGVLLMIVLRYGFGDKNA